MKFERFEIVYNNTYTFEGDGKSLLWNGDYSIDLSDAEIQSAIAKTLDTEGSKLILKTCDYSSPSRWWVATSPGIELLDLFEENDPNRLCISADWNNNVKGAQMIVDSCSSLSLVELDHK